MTLRPPRTYVSRGHERALFPIAVLTCVVLIAALFGMFLSRNAANQEEAETESHAVQAALDNARLQFAAQARAYAERLSPESFMTGSAGAGGPQPLAGPGGPAFVLDLARDFAPHGATGEFAPLFARVASYLAASGPAVDLRGALPESAASSRLGQESSLIAVAGGRAYVVALVPFAAPAGQVERPALLDVRPIDDRMLADLARAAGTERLEIGAASPDEGDTGAIRLDPASSKPDLAVVWRLERPGDRIVDRNAFFLIAFASIFALLVLFHSRRVTMEAASNEERARAAAGQDMLTGLPNRILFNRLLEGEVERVKRSINDRGAAVLLFDIDRLKEINDTAGEDVGDRLLVALSQRIVGLLRSSGRLARVGGDEFAILQTEIVGPRDAEMLARHVVDALAEPIDLGDRKVYVSVSIGIALCPIDSCDAEELMRRADLALYRAKHQGRNCYCFFETKTGEKLKLQKAVEDDLRAAIDRDELVLLYQPVMEVTGKRMVGVEALVRWPHPAHGFISPQNFIALAEECGLILPLGEWVLHRALTDLGQWPGLRVAVNVSGIQLREPNFVSALQDMLKERDVDPSRLELEVTENILLADADTAEEAMINVRAMGVRLALDDFGTGYSSLIYLRRFAFDKIKIDKSFLDSMEATGESAIIVHSIVHLGRALGLTVTAEGVEEPEQHRFLQALACHELQGYLFSKPVSAAEITKMLAKQNDAAPDQSQRRSVA